MNVAVIGTGYVGLVTGACLASLGHHVVGLDIDAEKIAQLQRGEVPIFEPGLERMVKEMLQGGALTFTLDPRKALEHAQAVFLAVGTPPKDDGSADLSFVLKAVEDCAPLLARDAVLITKSTVPVGTGKRLAGMLKTMGRTDIVVASNPEFLREGRAVEDFLHPDRIVVGADDSQVFACVRELYQGIDTLYVETSLESAEMIKYASNAFLATKISFINEIANMCEAVGASVDEVAHGMGLDPRIGKAFLRAGLGYGGSCFPKDVRALENMAGAHAYDFKLLKAVIAVNHDQRWRFFDRIVRELGDVRGKTIAIVGLAFKEGTDDIRESIGLDYATRLFTQGAIVHGYDPHANNVVKKSQPNIKVFENIYEAAHDADALIVTTPELEFTQLDFAKLKQIMNKAVLFDGRNIINAQEAKNYGFTLFQIGRKDD